MAVDTKRICGPKETFNPYNFVSKHECLDHHKSPLPVPVIEGKRRNGRELTKARALYVKAGLLSQADGSAYVEMDQTKVMAAVYGPREVTKRDDFSLLGQLTCEFKFATFSCTKRRSAMPESDEKDISMLILEAIQPAVCLHKFPKAQFNIHVTVLQHDGGVVPAAINCVSLALAEAGVQMYDLVSAVSARLHVDHILLDPSLEEEGYSEGSDEGSNNGTVTVALMASLNQVTALSCSGCMHVDSITQAIDLCVEVCHQLYTAQKHFLSVKNNT